MMISSSIMIEKQAMKIEKYSHKKSRFCLIQKKLDRKLALPGDGNDLMVQVDEPPLLREWRIPDFFLSHSTSTLS